MNLVRHLLFAVFFLVCVRPGFADQESQDQETKSLNILKQVMELNVAALKSGCIVDSKWLFNDRSGGPQHPLNLERSARVALEGENILTKTWYTEQYDVASKTMVPTNERETRTAYGGKRYIQTNGDGYLVSKNPANTYAVFDTFSAYPLTAMFAFLVPRQGWVTFSDVATPSNWSSYIADIKSITYDKAGNLIVTTLRFDGIKQEVTFSAANGFYPSKIEMSWDNNVFVTQVVDWTKTNVFGEKVQFVPKVILAQGGKKGEQPLPVFKITLDPQSMAKLPDITRNYFTLPVASDSLIYDMDVNTDIRVP